MSRNSSYSRISFPSTLPQKESSSISHYASKDKDRFPKLTMDAMRKGKNLPEFTPEEYLFRSLAPVSYNRQQSFTSPRSQFLHPARHFAQPSSIVATDASSDVPSLDSVSSSNHESCVSCTNSREMISDDSESDTVELDFDCDSLDKCSNVGSDLEDATVREISLGRASVIIHDYTRSSTSRSKKTSPVERKPKYLYRRSVSRVTSETSLGSRKESLEELRDYNRKRIRSRMSRILSELNGKIEIQKEVLNYFRGQ